MVEPCLARTRGNKSPLGPFPLPHLLHEHHHQLALPPLPPLNTHHHQPTAVLWSAWASNKAAELLLVPLFPPLLAPRASHTAAAPQDGCRVEVGG